jgi:AP-1 complex subunit mu
LVKRSYRNDVPHHINDKFNQKMVEYDEFNTVPLFMHDNYVFFFIKHENITILAVSTRNSNAMMIFSFLHELKKIWIEYFKNLEAESVKDNMIMIYELLDEIMDNGYPQSTEIKSLKKMIKTKHHELKKDKNSKKNKNEANQMANSLSSNIPWRPGTYKYNRNEAYLDVIEKVNMLVIFQPKNISLGRTQRPSHQIRS